MRMSKAQREWLGIVIAEYDATILREFRNWGVESTLQLAEKGILMTGLPFRTRDALIDAGLLEVGKRGSNEHQELRRGSFGRWIGGSRTRVEGWVTLRPTATGRKLLAR